MPANDPVAITHDTPRPSGMHLPVGDWQFWIVTLIALAAAAWLLRGVLPLPALRQRLRQRRQSRRATLTIEGRSVSAHHKRE